jgi:hypothetical protein
MATESQIGTGPEDIPESEDEQPPDVEQSFMDQLRARRTAIASETTKQFNVPGYDGLLVATYRRMGYEELVKIVRRAANVRAGARNVTDVRAELNAQMDFIIRACVSIDGEDGTHIADGYTVQLAEFFEFQSERAREILEHVFSNELAIAAHQAEVLRWMQSGEGELIEEFQGE